MCAPAEGSRWKNLSLTLIDAETRDKPKLVKKVHDLVYGAQLAGHDGKIVRKAENKGDVTRLQTTEKRVITEDKQKRREGAALLNPAPDEDTHVRVLSDHRGHPCVKKQRSNNALDPAREASFPNSRVNEIMIYRVEGFARVKEEDELKPALTHCSVVVMVERAYVNATLSAFNKTLLRLRNVMLKRGGDGARDNPRNDSIRGVVDHNWSGSVRRVGSILGNGEETPSVEVARGLRALAKRN